MNPCTASVMRRRVRTECRRWKNCTRDSDGTAMSSVPIGEHALLSDRHSAAMVSSASSVDWLCMPRFDSPSIFAAILDDEAGHWSIHPDSEFRVERQYLPGSMVLLTTFYTSTGILELCDAMALGDTLDPHALGEHAPHLLAGPQPSPRDACGS